MTDRGRPNVGKTPLRRCLVFSFVIGPAGTAERQIVDCFPRQFRYKGRTTGDPWGYFTRTELSPTWHVPIKPVAPSFGELNLHGKLRMEF
jgi:hypothetical protein